MERVKMNQAIRREEAVRRDHYIGFAPALLLLVCILLSVAANAQDANPITQATTPKAGTETKSNPTTVAPGEFYDKGLDLHFNYPVEMRLLDADAEMERGHKEIYGVPGANDPEHMEARRCMRFLLDADLTEDKAPKRPARLDGVANDPHIYDKLKPEPISAKILLVEAVRDCLPKELQQDEDRALSAIALSFVSQNGIERMPKPLWYETANQKIHMNSGAGQLGLKGDPPSAPIFIMSMATAWRGHLLAWVFTSNDTEIFNEITKSQVKFGDGPWGPMFAANIGNPGSSGKPITILPK